ncbi:MAG: substrate-binding domain-containing protein [Planctomycetes bacterium]|nr:substrate-binding domain-containing protein [Planctomycetota bacterium]
MSAFLKSLMVLALGLALMGSAATAQDGVLRIGYACSNLGDLFQQYVLGAAQDAAESRGDVLLFRDAAEDLAIQEKQVMELLAEGVDALVVVPVETKKVDRIVAMAKIAAVPVVFVNRNPFAGQRPPEGCFYVGTDAFAEGEEQMRFVGKQIGADGRIAVLQGILVNEATHSRTQGVRHVVSSVYPGMALLAESSANWQRDQAKDVTRAWLGQFGPDGLDAIIANNDMMALGALDVLEDMGIRDIVVVGVDAVPEALDAIAVGRLAASVVQDPVAQGSKAIEMARQAVQKAKQPQVVIFPSRLVTRENVAAYRERSRDFAVLR